MAQTIEHIWESQTVQFEWVAGAELYRNMIGNKEWIITKRDIR